MSKLYKYSIKSMNLGRMSGVSLGVHAIPDSFLLMHTGVGCKYKAAATIANHDWDLHPNRREGWTEVGDSALLRGSAQRIGPYARTWAARRKPAVMAMVISNFLAMTGEDFLTAARQAEASIGCPVLPIVSRRFEGDLFEGYAELILEVSRKIDWSADTPEEGLIGIFGYFFDRYEGDHRGNFQQLAFLLQGLGLKLGPVLLSGRPYAELLGIGRCGHVLGWPHLRPVADQLAALCPRPMIPVDLPMGLSGTANWLRRLGEATGVDPRRTERFITMQQEHVLPELAKVANRWRGMQVVIFADTPLAAGLCGLVMEMGLRPAVVGLRDGSLGGREAFMQALQRGGHRAPGELRVVEHPSVLEVRDTLRSLEQGDGAAIMIASSGEHSGYQIPTVEIGFPSIRHHVARPDPYMGFGGVTAFAQRMMTVLCAKPVNSGEPHTGRL